MQRHTLTIMGSNSRTPHNGMVACCEGLRINRPKRAASAIIPLPHKALGGCCGARRIAGAHALIAASGPRLGQIGATLVWQRAEDGQQTRWPRSCNAPRRFMPATSAQGRVNSRAVRHIQVDRPPAVAAALI